MQVDNATVVHVCHRLLPYLRTNACATPRLIPSCCVFFPQTSQNLCVSVRSTMTYFSQNTNSFNITNINPTLVTSADGRAELLSWLSPLEPHKRHQDVRIRRYDGIGDWLLETPEFKRWRNGHDGSSTLYVSGAPGAGKTYLRCVL